MLPSDPYARVWLSVEGDQVIFRHLFVLGQLSEFVDMALYHNHTISKTFLLGGSISPTNRKSCAANQTKIIIFFKILVSTFFANGRYSTNVSKCHGDP